MNKEERNKLKAELQREVFRSIQIKLAYGFAAFILAIFWAFYLLKKLFGFDVYNFLHPPTPEVPNRTDFSLLYLIIAIVATLIIVPWAHFKVKKIKDLASNGLETKAIVISRGMLERRGMVPVTFTYTIDGKEYKFKKDMLSSTYQVGVMFDILYDPKNPARHEVL